METNEQTMIDYTFSRPAALSLLYTDAIVYLTLSHYISLGKANTWEKTQVFISSW